MIDSENSDFNFDSFLKVDRATWLNKIKNDLKLNSLSSLDQTFGNYFKITPFTDESFLKENNIQPIVLPPTDTKYLIAESLMVFNNKVKEINKQLLELLERGIQTPILFLQDIISPQNFKTLFSGVSCEYLFLHFHMVENTFHKTETNFINFLASRNQNLIEKNSTLLGAINISSGLFKKMTKAELTTILEVLMPSLPKFDFFYIESLNMPEKNYNFVNHVAHLGTELNSFLEIAEKNNLPLQTIVDKMRIRCTVGTSYYVEIAKFRAIKIVTANVIKSWSLIPRALPIDVVYVPENQDFSFNKSEDDSIHKNKISATVQVLSAYLGGATTVTSISTIFLDDSHTSAAINARIFGNIQHILQLESGIPNINDVAGGSYYIEQLTTRIAEAAWKIISG